jgi:hypothetical protein
MRGVDIALNETTVVKTVSLLFFSPFGRRMTGQPLVETISKCDKHWVFDGTRG